MDMKFKCHHGIEYTVPCDPCREALSHVQPMGVSTTETPSADSELAKSQPSVEALAVALRIAKEFSFDADGLEDADIQDAALAIDARVAAAVNDAIDNYAWWIGEHHRLSDRVAELEAQVKRQRPAIFNGPTLGEVKP